MEIFLLYIWLKLDAVIGIVISCGILMLGLAFCYLMYAMGPDVHYSDAEQRKPIYLPKCRRLVIGACLVFGLALLIPGKVQTAVLVGGHYALKMADTPEAQKIAGLLRKKANEFLDEELAEKTK